jgi:hypothetical protein
MAAGVGQCACAECGVVCRGRFNGCSSVWLHSPIQAAPAKTPARGASAPPKTKRTKRKRARHAATHASSSAGAATPVVVPADAAAAARLRAVPRVPLRSDLSRRLEGARAQVRSLSAALAERPEPLSRSGDTR